MKSGKFALGKERGIGGVCFQVVLSVRTLVGIKSEPSHPYFRGTGGHAACHSEPFPRALASAQRLTLACPAPRARKQIQVLTSKLALHGN